MIEAKPDPVVHRYKPDGELLAHAHNVLLEHETHCQRYVRQRYSEAFGALRVALDALREIYPSETDCLAEHEQLRFGAALNGVQLAAHELGNLQSTVLGDAMVDVLAGRITSIAEFEKEWGHHDQA